MNLPAGKPFETDEVRFMGHMITRILLKAERVVFWGGQKEVVEKITDLLNEAYDEGRKDT